MSAEGGQSQEWLGKLECLGNDEAVAPCVQAAK